MKYIARLTWTAAELARRSRAIVGRAGRYMSMASGPMAVSAPRMTAMR